MSGLLDVTFPIAPPAGAALLRVTLRVIWRPPVTLPEDVTLERIEYGCAEAGCCESGSASTESSANAISAFQRRPNRSNTAPTSRMVCVSPAHLSLIQLGQSSNASCSE